jgi:hypothetical protein
MTQDPSPHRARARGQPAGQPASATRPADPSPNSALEALGYDAVINIVVSHLDKEEHKVLRSVSKDLRDASPLLRGSHSLDVGVCPALLALVGGVARSMHAMGFVI